MFLMGLSMVSTVCVRSAAMWFSVRPQHLETFFRWVFSGVFPFMFLMGLQWCRPSVWGRPPCGLQFVAADSRIQTLLLLAILGFRVFGAVLASPGFVVTLHRHLSDSEVCEAMVFGGLVS
ncbi:hypothetical protein K438DRAFT_281318 [Mycena galopus ATCC 62051]|nr:hypothetical protein K438DRAFT_281318 [Mycena galopus ATCC 62051]